MPLKYTSGYHPRVKLSLGPALAVGIKSESQYVTIFLTKSIETGGIMDRLNKDFPEGIKILEIKEI